MLFLKWQVTANINESRNAAGAGQIISQHSVVCILWYLDCSLAFVILFRTPPPGQYFMRGEIIPSLVAAVMLSCLMAQLGPGQAPCECRRERERERESGPESILQLTTVTTSPASSAPAATQHPQHKVLQWKRPEIEAPGLLWRFFARNCEF